jgi:hypothetical protein
MEITGAVIREQGVTFAVVLVKPHVVSNSNEASQAIAGFTPVFRVPVVLMAQDSHGRPTYYGRHDIARFMSGVPVHAIPWKKYSIN